MGLFLADGRAVFAVQGHIEHAAAKLFHHLRLQGQALAHAVFNTAVVVADRQCQGPGLGAEQYLGGMEGGNTHGY
ncbi:hypothetical protein GCM10027195_01020 [Comamonas sediminis]